jgi:hypothetical protein
MAKKVREKISGKIKLGVRNERIRLLKFETDWRPEMQNQARKRRPISWTVSNMGMMGNGLQATKNVG